MSFPLRNAVIGLLLALGVVAAVAGRMDLMALALVGAVAGFLAATIGGTRRTRASEDIEGLGSEDVARLGPIRRLRKEILEIVERRRAEPAVAVVGKEAVSEADRVVQQCVSLLRHRRDLTRAVSGRSEAAREIAALESEVAGAKFEAERMALQSALDARRREASHYEEAGLAIEKIESGLRQAQASLSEMKARLGAVSAENLASSTELEETIGSLRTLGASLDEAESWLREQA